MSPRGPQCNHLTVSGTTITAGADIVFNSGTTYDPSVASLSATAAVVCYEDDGNSSAYRDAGSFATIPMTFRHDGVGGGTLRIGARQGKGFPGMLDERTFNVVLVRNAGQGGGVGPTEDPDQVVEYYGYVSDVVLPPYN